MSLKQLFARSCCIKNVPSCASRQRAKGADKKYKRNVEKQIFICHNTACGVQRPHSCDADSASASLSGASTRRRCVLRVPTTRGRQHATSDRTAAKFALYAYRGLDDMHTVEMGAENDTKGLQAPIQYRAAPFQRHNSLPCSGRVRQYSPGRNFHIEGERSYKSGPSRGDPQRFLLEVFSGSKKRLKISI